MSDAIPSAVETVPEVKPACPEEAAVAWANGLSASVKKVQIKACLDEYESCAATVRRLGRKISPEALKACKAWGEHQKRLLRLLGHKHRLSVIGGARFDVGKEESIFEDGKEAVDNKASVVAS